MDFKGDSNHPILKSPNPMTIQTNITRDDARIVAAATKDAVDGSKTPSIRMKPVEHELYTCCLAAILGYMRSYNSKAAAKFTKTTSEITEGILTKSNENLAGQN